MHACKRSFVHSCVHSLTQSLTQSFAFCTSGHYQEDSHAHQCSLTGISLVTSSLQLATLLLKLETLSLQTGNIVVTAMHLHLPSFLACYKQLITAAVKTVLSVLTLSGHSACSHSFCFMFAHCLDCSFLKYNYAHTKDSTTVRVTSNSQTPHLTSAED